MLLLFVSRAQIRQLYDSSVAYALAIYGRQKVLDEHAVHILYIEFLAAFGAFIHARTREKTVYTIACVQVNAEVAAIFVHAPPGHIVG